MEKNRANTSSERDSGKKIAMARLKHQLKTDRHGVNVWPYASAMLDESSQVNISHIQELTC